MECAFKHKISIIFMICVSILLSIFIKVGYSDFENVAISHEEIEKTFENIKRESTTNKTFLRRVKVLDARCVLLATSGRAYEVIQIAPPGWIPAIMSLKQNGKENEAFLKLDNLYKEIGKLGIPKREEDKPILYPQDVSSADLTESLSSQKTSVKELKASLITANISIDYLNTLGTFSPYIFGAISGPYFDQSGFNLTQNAGFRLITVFIDSIKPLPIDVNNPSQYDFELLDKQVEAILNIGAEPMITFAPLRKPSDLKKYSIYIQNIVKHLTQGWGNGHRWNINIFRFGNEPDNTEYWKDTQQNFFETYAEWAKVLKGVNQNFILVAPGLMQVRVNFHLTSLNAWIINFLEYCNMNSIPVDYFSFHAYSPFPYHLFYENIILLESELQKFPKLSPLYGIPRLANDEWQIKVGDLWSGSKSKQFDTAWAAAHNINVLINMIEQGVQLSVPMTGTFNGGEKGCHDFLLVDCYSQGKPSFYAFKGFNWLYGTNRLSTSGTDHMNFAAMAGKSSNGVMIVFSNYDVVSYLAKYESLSHPVLWNEYNINISKRGIPNIYNKFSIRVDNLPWLSSQKVAYEHYLVDDTHKLTLVESKTVAGNKTLLFTGEMTAPCVHIIKAYMK